MHMTLLYPLWFSKECEYYQLDPWGIGILTLHVLESDFRMSYTSPELNAYNTQGPRALGVESQQGQQKIVRV